MNNLVPYHLNDRYIVSRDGLIYDTLGSVYLEPVFVKRSEHDKLDGKKPSVLLRRVDRSCAYRFISSILAEVFLNNNEQLHKGQKVLYKDGDHLNVEIDNLFIGARNRDAKNYRKRKESADTIACWLNGDAEIYC